MSGLLGKKVGMTTIFDDNGKYVACTVIETGPCVVTQVKTVETDGYAAVQLGFIDKKEKHTTLAMKGHFAKAKSGPKRHIKEFKFFKAVQEQGQTLKVEDVFEIGDFVDVAGTSKGKGFQGVVKRHGFSGVGMATHGQHNRLRAPGSLGASSYPSRVFKGMRMAGRTGGDLIKVQNLRVLKIVPEQNILVVSGAVPGAKGAILMIEK